MFSSLGNEIKMGWGRVGLIYGWTELNSEYATQELFIWHGSQDLININSTSWNTNQKEFKPFKKTLSSLKRLEAFWMAWSSLISWLLSGFKGFWKDLNSSMELLNVPHKGAKLLDYLKIKCTTCPHTQKVAA